ncbi:hypothetical protein B0T17DRAFT_530503 [Bombardia bombarda]|uniref:FAD dependent oxidoreductase domain-containing protein n=1 Tax=Bombardia bombarda TaxID=252184 RepID=A0AA39WZV3_9PEZI|nr:hypothetical protein B0T17DRAFT_530503 [Bombardia bombarda]
MKAKTTTAMAIQEKLTSYLIIGAGSFGASTALALKKAEPDAHITVIDRTPFPCPYAAAHDVNKICRGDYGDLMYMKLAIRSMESWTADPLYSRHFHNSGMLYAYDDAYLRTIIANWEAIYGEGNAPSHLLDLTDAKQRFGGIFENADWSAAERSLWSPQAERLKHSPVMALMATLPAESLPPGDDRVLKCMNDTGFSNNVYHEPSKQKLSIPPSKVSQLTWSQDMPQVLKDELRTIGQELHGGLLSKLVPTYYRMCWDGFTPNQDFIICAHPHAQNLYIVGGGSFHACEFLPVMGDIVVQMLRGELDGEMERRFAWDRPNDGHNSHFSTLQIEISVIYGVRRAFDRDST